MTASTCSDLEVSVQNGVLQMIEHQQARAAAPARGGVAAESLARLIGADDWFAEGTAAREHRSGVPRSRRTRAQPRRDPDNAAAWINWGRLLHESGERACRGEGLSPRARALRHRCAAALQPAACCSRTSATRRRLSRPITPRSRRTPTSPTATTIWRGSTSRRARPQHAIRHLGQYRRLLTRQRALSRGG